METTCCPVGKWDQACCPRGDRRKNTARDSAASTGQLHDGPTTGFGELVGRGRSSIDLPGDRESSLELHFGRGIVQTLDDFGHAGARPSHPELLDWLALELVRQEGRLKGLHRKMLLTRAYEQTSLVTEASLAADPDGVWLSRMPMTRPQAEIVRDRMLAVAGRLDRQRWGEPVPVVEQGNGLVSVAPSPHGERRSIYVLHRRTKLPTLLETFDSPQMSPNCTQRDESLVSLQALHLLNNAHVHELAIHFARRRSRGSRRVPNALKSRRFIDSPLSRADRGRTTRGELLSLRPGTNKARRVFVTGA
ncbi:MAG: DUF1553 domain-containing protein [Pirellulaceae bacterium]